MWQRANTVASTYADRDLLFEALALHLGFVPRGAVAEARKAMMTGGEVAPSLAEALVARAALAADRRAVLDMLVDDLLARHEGNLRRCLDDLSSFGRLRRDLDRRLAGQESHHPTVASISIASPLRSEGEGEEAVLNGNSGANQAAAAFAADNDDENDVQEDAEYEWSLGASRRSWATASRSCTCTLAEASGWSPWRSIPSFSARSPSSRSRPRAPTTLIAGPGSCWRPRVTGRLEHPGVVPVYGLGFDDQGRPYYAMRFVPRNHARGGDHQVS